MLLQGHAAKGNLLAAHVILQNGRERVKTRKVTSGGEDVAIMCVTEVNFQDYSLMQEKGK